jgi:cyclic peptide transporter
MEFLKLIFKKSKYFILFIVLLGIVNSILNSGLLLFINNTVSQKPIPFFPENAGTVFLAIILTSLVVSQRFQVFMIRLTNDILFEFEVSILQKLRYASFEDFEKLGKEKVYTAINDSRVLANVPQLFINSFNSLIMVLCCLGYMFWISPVGGLVVLGVLTTLLIVYLLRNRRAEKDLNELRDLQTSYYVHLRDLLEGFREIKMSVKRNDTIFNRFLLKNRIKSKAISINTAVRYMNNELTGSYSWYIVLGVIMFILPQIFNFTIGQVSSFMIIILYLIGPVAGLITFIPIVTRVKIALNRLNEYETLLDANIKGKIMHGDMQDINSQFQQIEFRDVTYEYYDKEKERIFVLGPLNVTISQGEKIFITGGNGSGKTTFVKLLTGLYKPVSGEILLNGHVISDKNLPYYRDQISAIFTDNYLFEENYNEFDLDKHNAKLRAYIEVMKLTDIIRTNETNYELSRSLSQGQRKRLAMIMALMEARQIIVLDEWAAEQDPQFRAYFYRKILPYLLDNDKTIIAITHDDNYYHLAGRIIKFDYGKIVSDDVVKDKQFVLQAHV